MNSPGNNAPPRVADPPERVLRRLFLTLFLRGRSARGLQKEGAPKSVGRKLAFTLIFYVLFGLLALAFVRQPVFGLSLYLHAMTFVFLGMFVASSAGEVLFNKEEGDILLHRPVTPRALLWAKIGVLVQVSLWLAGAFNLVGFFVGITASDSGWLFPLAHAISTMLESLFCTGFVVMTYQLCLRWFGRERLDGLMTTAQVLVSVGLIVGSQLMPRYVIGRTGQMMPAGARSWWLGFLPPAWFAGFNDAIAGSGMGSSWLLAALAVGGTAVVLWLAFGKLARDYETGLQTLSESTSAGPKRNRRWVSMLVKVTPLRWFLRDSVSRAAFMLSVAYLLRDRETKLRVFPSITPMVVFPLLLLFQGGGDAHHGSGFGVAFAGGYLGLIPLLGLNLLQYSQQWQAADLFRAAPMPGPLPLCHGARWAVLSVLTLPMLMVFAVIVLLLASDISQIVLLLPGIIVLPIYALVPCLGGKAVPLSLPTEEAKSAGRGLTLFGVMMFAVALSGLTAWAWSGGWFWWLVLVESVLAAGTYAALSASLRSVRWSPLE